MGTPLSRPAKPDHRRSAARTSCSWWRNVTLDFGDLQSIDNRAPTLRSCRWRPRRRSRRTDRPVRVSSGSSRAPYPPRTSLSRRTLSSHPAWTGLRHRACSC